ncbi:hypothetical protein BQ8482_110105 [Mesorhizobium delmotii]|uniref:Uncharacterized protein n=1 Tax=Mesorhizobium delmotii TaxID=1631247 RepID=A0A2P9AAL6_9HYPH|nr:hypothetical protein BQ8482_110105 [Mesorhizobium delmotii]
MHHSKYARRESTHGNVRRRRAQMFYSHNTIKGDQT